MRLWLAECVATAAAGAAGAAGAEMDISQLTVSMVSEVLAGDVLDIRSSRERQLLRLGNTGTGTPEAHSAARSARRVSGYSSPRRQHSGGQVCVGGQGLEADDLVEGRLNSGI